MSTLIDKIGKRKDKSIDDLYDVQDIGCVRVVLNNCEEVYKLKTNLEKEPTTHKIRKVKDYIATPKLTGYRGIHIIYSLINKKIKLMIGAN